MISSFVKQQLRQVWRYPIILIALLTLSPIAVVLASYAYIDPTIWAHLWQHQLPLLLKNTAYLVTGVGAGVVLVGVSLAYLVTRYEFTGRRFFYWALMLPLAVPTYVMAFAQLGIFDYQGPIQSLLRQLLGSSKGFPSIQSTAGVIIVMILALYPYVFLLARDAFERMGQRAIEVGQSLGLSPQMSFLRIILPASRPWLIGGMSLALMEALSDFGAVSILNFDTFTTAIYHAWFSLFSLDTAKQLASILILLVFILLWLELRSRGARRYHNTGRSTPLRRIPLRGWQKTLCLLYLGGVLCFAFIFPLLRLISWALDTQAHQFDVTFGVYVFRTLLGSALAALLVVMVALILVYALRQAPSPINQIWAGLATLGYAVPGTVLAVGLIVPITYLDRLLLALFDLPPQQIVQGTLGVLLLAYLVRFLAVAHAPLTAAMGRITRHHEEAARNLGRSGWRLFYDLHLPLLSSGITTALLMVMVDVMKEMPITLMLRPFDWDTLAVRIFGLTMEGEWERAALPALALVTAGLLPVLLLSRTGSAQQRSKPQPKQAAPQPI